MWKNIVFIWGRKAFANLNQGNFVKLLVTFQIYVKIYYLLFWLLLDFILLHEFYSLQITVLINMTVETYKDLSVCALINRLFLGQLNF